MNLESHAKAGQPLLLEEWNRKKREERLKEEALMEADAKEAEARGTRMRLKYVEEENRRLEREVQEQRKKKQQEEEEEYDRRQRMYAKQSVAGHSGIGGVTFYNSDNNSWATTSGTVYYHG